jgi:hypothetical protein
MCIAFPRVASRARLPWYRSLFTFISFFTLFLGALLKGLFGRLVAAIPGHSR